MKPQLSDIHKAVELHAKCRATHFESRVVTVKQFDEPLSRSVATFALLGHASAKRAYAWPKLGDGRATKPTYTIILSAPGINSAEDALTSVMRAIMREL